MRFLRKSDVKKTVLVISDIHLGAGAFVNGQRNFLEDFLFDEELVDFFDYHSKGDYGNRDVEVIINGDFLDLLAVPFVPFFDDDPVIDLYIVQSIFPLDFDGANDQPWIFMFGGSCALNCFAKSQHCAGLI